MASGCNGLFLLLVLLSCPLIVKAKQDFTSVYTFGDSSNAAIDIAVNLHLPSPKPYYTQEQPDFASGLSFSTPEATIMSPYFFLKNGIVPPPQSHYLSQISTFTNSFHNKNKSLVQSALIFMDKPGINDYKHAFLHGKSISEVSLLVPDVVETIINSADRLVNEAGAKIIFISGSLPMGCFPGFRSMFPKGDIAKECHEGLNKFSKLHNGHLARATQELQSRYADVQIIYVDYYNAFRDILRDHERLGFDTDTLMKAYCGSGTGPFNFDLLKQCGEKGEVYGSGDMPSYIHWDGFQLTPEALDDLIHIVFIRDDSYSSKD